MYLEFVGPMTLSDSCGIIEPVLNRKFVPFAPQDIVTMRPSNEDLQAAHARPKGGWDILTIADFACPTMGYGRSTEVDGRVNTLVGEPWLPLVVFLGHALSNLDHNW